MVMAGSPVRQNGSTAVGPTLSRPQIVVLAALADGKTAPEIANRLSKGNKQKARQIRSKLRRWATQPEFRNALFEVTQGNMILALPEINEALVRRAARGRPDAAKMIWSATGFHNDKVSHEHSGGIEITVSIPRPATTVDTLGPGKDPEGFVDSEAEEL